MKVIEPSEIIIDKQGLPREDTSRVNPWIRLLARAFDYALFFALLGSLRRLFHGHWPFGPFQQLIPYEFFVWIPFEALLLSTWGTTPGKRFLKVTLKQGRRGRLDFYTAIKRSFLVWFRGLGMGIPGINFFCLLFAYQRLQVMKQTSWDREEHTAVFHQPIGRWRLIAVTLIVIGASLFYKWGT